MITIKEQPSIVRRIARISGVVVCVIALALSGCKKQEQTEVPDAFNSFSTEKKMAYLMKTLPPDSVARFVCESAMGKQYGSNIELADALMYAYTNYKEADQIVFDEAFNRYGDRLPLSDKMKFYQMANLSDPEIFEYEIGLRYVSSIREEEKDAKKVKVELEKFKSACKNSPETYKRFMKGFKEALRLDRGHDLDERIYTQFITYPDTI